MSPTIPPGQPSKEQLTAFSRARVFFGHQSVGANILTGMAANYEGSGVPPVAVVESNRVPPAGPGFLAHALIGSNGDPLGKLAAFADVMSGPMGRAVDVAILKFCYADVVVTTDPVAVFDAYVATMARLEAAHPGVRFLYCTVPLTTDRTWKSVLRTLLRGADGMGAEDNVVRHAYNQLVREGFGDSGRLFDVAAVEATLAGDPMVRSTRGAIYHVLNRALSSDAGHLNAVGAKLAAAELLRAAVGSEPR